MEDLGRQLPVNIEEEMKASYLDYAMSVIVGRALPDVRDGLKPVHRRVLYAMSELNNTFDKPHKKSARVVGEVIGKFHPHGETAVYDTIVRMAQEFSMRETLIDGQGNFGSIDGDSPAAMRYTEVRMSRLASELLADIEKDTVDFQPNYDESLVEPLVLPTRVPNLLINGAAGIAVGMATNIPPHNLGEVIDALLLVLERPHVPLAEIMRVLPGPDFPTGAFIHGRQGIWQAYETGRGLIQMRAKTSFEEVRKERDAIIIDELPYQVNKARLIEKIADLVHERRIDGIADLRDESSREGMRVVIEIKRGENPEVIQNQLFKLTPMQSSFGVTLLALVDGQPRVLPLAEMLRLFLEHRKEVVRRRTLFELDKAEKRAHILEGLKKALDHLDQVIAVIRSSGSPVEARENLVSDFGFSEVQAQAILEMRLQRLTALEREKIDSELKEVIAIIARLKEILANEQLLKEVIREELVQIRSQYQNERRTVIVDAHAELTIEDLIPEEQVVITVTHNGYIKRTALDVYKSQGRGGKGRRGMSLRTEEDIINYLFVASTHSYILIFTDKGKVYWLKVYAIPDAGAAGRGKPIVNMIKLEKDEKIADVISLSDASPEGYLVMVSRKGYIKKTKLEAFSKPRSTGLIACRVEGGDSLLKVDFTRGDEEILLCTRQGKSIRFSESQFRAMGRNARGVKGVELRGDDEVVAMCVVADPGANILSVTENGFGKRTALSEYRLQSRAGLGVINIKTSSRNGDVVTSCPVTEDAEIILVTTRGKIIRLETDQIRQTMTRNAQGVKLIDLEEDDKVADVTVLPIEEEDGENGGQG